jgi:hypothetical protein
MTLNYIIIVGFGCEYHSKSVDGKKQERGKKRKATENESTIFLYYTLDKREKTEKV